MKNKRLKADMAEEEKQERKIRKQVEKAEQTMQPGAIGSDQPPRAEVPRELKVEDGLKIRFSLGSSSRPVTKEKHEGLRVVFEEVEGERNEVSNPGGSLNKKESGGGKSALDEFMREEEKKKEKIDRKDYCLCEGIVLKVMCKALEEKGYYKQKGVVRQVIDKHVGELEMLDGKRAQS